MYCMIETTRKGRLILDAVGQRYCFTANPDDKRAEVSCRVRRDDAPTLLELIKENGEFAAYGKKVKAV